MTPYDVTANHFEKCLGNLDKWIDKAIDFAKAKKFEPNDLLTARLAPDMYPLVKQVQSVCDQAKFVCARSCGKEAPSHPDTEKTWDELRTRIRSVREYVKGYKPADFEGCEARMISLPWMPGKVLTGKDYIEFSLGNFAFHYTTVYAILRHNGVDVGKQDYMGAIPFRDA